MTQRFEQRIDLAGSLRPIIVPMVVAVALCMFLVGALVGASNPDSPTPVRWLVGLAAGLIVMLPVVLLRIRILKRSAASGSLEVDDRGLVARYGGTIRTLEWSQVHRLERRRKPVSAAANPGSVGGAMVIGAMNAASRSSAPKSLGVIGVGSWAQGADATLAASQLAALSATAFGGAPGGGAVVPIWFDDYGPEAEQQLPELVKRYRPDLVTSERRAL